MSLLAAVAADDLHEVWPWVREGLERLMRKCRRTGRAPDWLPEDVYASIRSGVSVLFVIGEREGFVVLQRQTRPFGPILFVWIIVGALKRYEQELYAALEDMARKGGMRRIQANSPFRGWGNRGWFVPVETVYERVV